MSTRAVVRFVNVYDDHEYEAAMVYRHSDGYPSGMLPTLRTFFNEVKRQTKDTRFDDASYLAAKFVVYLSRIFAHKYEWPDGVFKGEPRYTASNPLDFLSVGIVKEIPGDVEYVYTVACGRGEEPTVTYRHHAFADENEDMPEFSEFQEDESEAEIWSRYRL